MAAEPKPHVLRIDAVREAAERFDLPTAGKKDSQGICFIGNIKMTDFLSHHIPDNPGEIVDVDGRVLGEHRGLHLFTLGQRRGHGVASPRDGAAYVVAGKDFERNRLILGWDEESTPGLYVRECRVGSLSSINDRLEDVGRLMAQPRYRAKAEPVEAAAEGEGLRLRFARPQRALTPGQICAFYDNGRLLGGGVFEHIGE